MSLIQKPNILNFAGNLLPVIYDTSSDIQFQLLEGSTLIINETHSPVNGRIKIDIKDVVCDHLDYSVPGQSEELKIQHSAVKEFTFKIDGLAYKFKAIKGGISEIIDINIFLQNNFLTWQAQVKEISPDSIEFLSYYALKDCDAYIRVYTDNGGRYTRTLHLTAGHLFNINTSYNIIKFYYQDENIVGYDVWVETDGNRLSYIQRYLLRSSTDKDFIYLFENSVGGFDTLIADGERITKRKTDSDVVSVLNKNSSTNKKFDIIYTQNTGYITDSNEAKWLQDLFVSNKIFQLSDKLAEVYIKESDNNFKDGELNYFSFSFSLTEQSEYNKVLQRETNLTVFNYSERDLFFLENRLQDLPLLDVSGEVFIPGENRNGIIGKVCLSSVIRYVTNNINYNDIEGIPSLAEYVKLRYLEENYLMKDSKLIDQGILVYDADKNKSITLKKAPDSDKLDGLDSTDFVQVKGKQTISGSKRFSSEQFFKKIIIGDKHTPGEDGVGGLLEENQDGIFAEVDYLNVRNRVKIAKELAIGDYSPGWAGNGGLIKRDEHGVSMEIDRLSVRKTARFYEMLVKKYRTVGGTLMVSNGEKSKEVENSETAGLFGMDGSFNTSGIWSQYLEFKIQ